MVQATSKTVDFGLYGVPARCLLLVCGLEMKGKVQQSEKVCSKFASEVWALLHLHRYYSHLAVHRTGT